jgi:carbonic anhydrase
MRAKKILRAAAVVATTMVLASGAAAMRATAPENPGQHVPAKPSAATPAPAHTNEKMPAKAAASKTSGAQMSKPKPMPAASSGGGSAAEAPVAGGASSSESAAMTPAKALQLLREGNVRWVEAEPDNPNISPARRADVGKSGQHPFVTVLTCADSRLPVERIFDRGVGDVFVVRVAGNIAGESEVGTIEYGVEHLKTPLIVVMGHTKCGAVAAASSGAAAKLHGSLQQLVRTIEPGVDRARRNNPDAQGDELISLAIRENVWQSVYDMLKRSPDLRQHVRDGDVRVVGAVCDIITGKVDFLGPHPWQSELLDALEVRKPTMGTAEADKGEH